MRRVSYLTMALFLLLATSSFAGPQAEAAAEPRGAEGREAPMLREMVDAGELPTLEDRLPSEPMVIEPVEQIGEYGGSWNQVTVNWKEIGWIVHDYSYEKIVTFDRAGKKLIPNVCRDYEASNGGRTYTFYLREGMRWSDGNPFDADDVVFWYDDVLSNEELYPTFSQWFKSGGEPGVVSKTDDYTVVFDFKEPHGLFLGYLGATGPRPFLPKHYLSEFHPTYADADDLEEMAKSMDLDQGWTQLFWNKATTAGWGQPALGCPTVDPWVLQNEPPATRFVYDRNPYYWKVDTEGNQLPYLDQVIVSLVESAEIVNMKAVAGEVNFQARSTAFSNFTLFKENAEQSDYRVLLWAEGIGAKIRLFPNQNCPDPVLRRIFRDADFRRALSLAIDRNEINELVFLGQGKPMAATVVSSSPFFEQRFAEAYAEYDPDRANDLLDRAGLAMGDDGYRRRPDGKTLQVAIMVAGEEAYETDVLQLVKDKWEAVGVKTVINNVTRDTYGMRMDAYDFEIGTWRLGRAFYPLMNPAFWIPITPMQNFAPAWGAWYASGGESGEAPPADVKRMLYDVWEEIKVTVDQDKRIELFKKVLDAHAENVWMIGTVAEVPHIIIVKNNFRNVPETGIWATHLRYVGPQNVEQFYIDQ